MSPISFRMFVEQIFMSITDGEDQTISSNEPHLHQVLKIVLFKWHGETWERFTEQPIGLQYLDNFQNYCMDFLTVPNAWLITSGNIGGIKITVLCITRRNNSKMLLKNINGSLWTSWICSYSCRESYSSSNDFQIQRHWEQCWVTVSSGTRSTATVGVSGRYSGDDAERHSHSRQYHHHCWRSIRRISTVSCRLDKNRNDQIQKAHSWGMYVPRPELWMPVLHQKSLVYKLEKLNWPPHCEIKRRSWKDVCWLSIRRMRGSTISWIRSTSTSVDSQNLGLAKQLLTSKFELGRAQTEVSHWRSSVERNQSSQTRDAEDLRNLRAVKSCLWLVSISGILPRLTDESSTWEQWNWRQFVFDLNGKTRKNFWTVGVALSVRQVSDQEIPLN